MVYMQSIREVYFPHHNFLLFIDGLGPLPFHLPTMQDELPVHFLDVIMLKDTCRCGHRVLVSESKLCCDEYNTAFYAGYQVHEQNNASLKSVCGAFNTP